MISIYLVLAYKNPTQLHKLIQALDTGETIFLIHIDSNIAIQPFLNMFKKDNNSRIFFTPKRYHVSWINFSLLEAILCLIQYYFKLGIRADYFHLISGEDYPTKSNDYIKNFLEKNQGKSFMHYFTLANEHTREEDINNSKLNRWLNNEKNIICNNIKLKNKNTFLEQSEQITHYGGSLGWSLHLDCIKYINETCIKKSWLYPLYKNSLFPANMFLHTVIMNSHLKNTVENNNLRYVKWQKTQISSDSLFISNWDNLIINNKLFTHRFDLNYNIKTNNKPKLVVTKKTTQTNIQKNKILKKTQNKRSIIPKCCVISAVGKESLHNNWIDKKYNFDLHLIVYDNSYEKHARDTPYITQGQGKKFKLIYNYLILNKALIEKYDYFYIPDDDINIDSKNIKKLFGYMNEYKLAIAQPAIFNSYLTFKHTKRQIGKYLRYTNFVEIMQPCFSRKALKEVLFTFNENKSGWGIDFHWGKIVDYRKYNMAIIDDIKSIHTRPVQSNNPQNRAEFFEYVKKYDLKLEIKII